MAFKTAIEVGEHTVSGLFERPPSAKALFIFAHGAGAGMDHTAMASSSEGLARRGIASLRFQFLYMEQGKKRPDPPSLAHKVVRAAAATAAKLAPDLPLFAGGRSFGGRMSSQAQAQAPLPNVRGLVFLGFPLHPANKPSTDRAQHLSSIRLPMLFISGSRDALAELDLLRAAVAGLGEQASVRVVEHADHSFKVAVRCGKTSAAAENEALDAASDWMIAQLAESQLA